MQVIMMRPQSLASIHRPLRPHLARQPRVRALTAVPTSTPHANPHVSDSFTDSSVFTNLLKWANADSSSSDKTTLHVHVQDLGSSGRGLVALQDIQPLEVLLEVPFNKVFQSDPHSNLHWAADMAVRLLMERHKSTGLQQDQASPPLTTWSPWIKALPQHVLTPLAFSELELAILGDANTIAEVKQMQQYFHSCYYQELQPQLDSIHCTYEDFIWAVQVFCSRCFFEPSLGCHLAVPGIDMANHSFAPSAAVQIRHSTDYCQGREALADVAEPPPPSPSMFQLVAGPEGLVAGQEVTICYGSQWPNEPFLLLFGFVPDNNPREAVVLFPQLPDLARSYIRHAAGHNDTHQDLKHSSSAFASDDAASAQSQLLEAVLVHQGLAEAMASGNFDQLIVARDGLDSRLSEAVDLVKLAAEACSSSMQSDNIIRPVTLQQLVSAVCRERFNMMSMLQRAATETQDSDNGSQATSIAAEFRRQKQGILQDVLAQLELSCAPNQG